MIVINNYDLIEKNYNNQKVITLKDVDLVHGRPEGTARRNFNSNKERLLEGEDYYKVCADEIRTHKIMELSAKTHEDIIFLTESGYLMLVKSFTDDLAWNVQRQLVKNYFRAIAVDSYLIDDPIARAKRWIQEQEEKKKLITTNTELKEENTLLVTQNAAQAQIIAEMQPIVDYHDIILACPDALNISVIAKDYGWSAKRMNQWLHEQGVQYKQDGVWLLYQEHAKMHYTTSTTQTYIDKEGRTHCAVHTKWTQKGRIFIYELMKKNGLLPEVEQQSAANTTVNN